MAGSASGVDKTGRVPAFASGRDKTSRRTASYVKASCMLTIPPRFSLPTQNQILSKPSKPLQHP